MATKIRSMARKPDRGISLQEIGAGILGAGILFAFIILLWLIFGFFAGW